MSKPTDTPPKKATALASTNPTPYGSTLDVEAFVEEKGQSRSGLKDMALLKKLWPFVKPHQTLLWWSLALLIPTTATRLALPSIIQQAIDGPIQQGNLPELWPMVWLYLGLMALHYTLQHRVLVMSQVAGQKIIYDLRTTLYTHLQTLSPRFYHQNPVGKLVTRLTNDVENLSEMFSSGGLSILLDAAVLLGVIGVMLATQWQLALVVLVMVAVIVGLIEWLRRKSRNAYDGLRVKVAAMNAYLQESISGIEVVQLYQREARNTADFEAINQSTLKTSLSSVLYDCSMAAVTEALTLLTVVAILWLGSLGVADGHLSFGTLVAFFLYVQMTFGPIEDLAEKYTVIQAGLSSIDKVSALLQETPQIESSAHAAPMAPESDIAFEAVSFGYDPHTPVLCGLNFTVTPGQTVAIVGPTGSGKTTMMKLLTRFYDVDSGRITLGGIDIRDLPLDQLRQAMVVIQQDDFLFSRSLAENITLSETLANDPAEQPAIEAALRQAQAEHLIHRYPDGIDHKLEERGRSLSGGERQLLLFARAIYHNPQVLVLDEATASIDPQTEGRVQKALETLMEGRTAIIIAHRLSTIQKADIILVLHRGQLVEQGNHASLMALNGLYASYVKYQQGG